VTPGRAAWITGAGLVTALGEGRAAHRQALADPAAIAAARDSDGHAPFHTHPIRALDLDRFVPRRGDQRAMGPWMQYGVHAAALALEDAGMLGDAALLARTHLVTAAAGGERDLALDEAILAGWDAAPDPAAALNRQLADGLRPTAFLAQLPNMFAGNVSIVLGVAGSSRTFMGEEPAGAEAVRVAWRRIAAGQGDLFLVGAAYHADRAEMLLLHQMGGCLLQGPWRGLWDRPQGGVCLGSMAAFLVVEAADHARARGARPLARLAAVDSGYSDRKPGAAETVAAAQWQRLRPVLPAGAVAVLSGSTGIGSLAAAEASALAGASTPDRPLVVRGTGAAIGHGVEAAFLANLVLATWAVQEGALFPPLGPEPVEAAAGAGAIRHAAATGWGMRRGEALALVEAIDGEGPA